MTIDVILQRCAIAIHAPGPMPPWYRPFKRRAWKRSLAAIRAVGVAHAMQIGFQQVMRAAEAHLRAVERAGAARMRKG